MPRFGDIDPDLPSKSKFPAIAYALTIVNTFVVNVVLLNLLIAVMGGSYERVAERSKQSFYRLRAHLILMYEQRQLSTGTGFDRPTKGDIVRILSGEGAGTTATITQDRYGAKPYGLSGHEGYYRVSQVTTDNVAQSDNEKFLHALVLAEESSDSDMPGVGNAMKRLLSAQVGLLVSTKSQRKKVL